MLIFAVLVSAVAFFASMCALDKIKSLEKLFRDFKSSVGNIKCDIGNSLAEGKKLRSELKGLKELIGEEAVTVHPGNFDRFFFSQLTNMKYENPTLVERLQAMEKYLNVRYAQETKEFKGYKPVESVKLKVKSKK